MSRGSLSEAEVGSYRKDGFVFPVSVMSPAQSLAYRQHYEAVEAGARGRRGEIRQIRRRFTVAEKYWPVAGD